MLKANHLTEHDWLLRMADIAVQCGCGEPGEADELLSDLHALLLAPPRNYAWLRAGLPGTGRVQALLRAGAASSAALAMVEGRAGYMLSQGPEGRAMASLVLAGSPAEVTCSAADPALALAGALAEALSAALTSGAHEQRGDAAVHNVPAGARLN